MAYNVEFVIPKADVCNISGPDIVILYETYANNFVVAYHQMLRKNGYAIFNFAKCDETTITFWKCPEVIATTALNCFIELLDS